MTAPANPVQFSLLAFLSVLGSAVNLATAWALLRDARLRGRATSCFLVNLSLADLAFSLFNGPLDSAVFYYGGWTHGHRLCVAAALVRHVAVGSSLASIQLITLNRYTSVVKPRSYARIFSPGSCLLLAALCWVLPAGTAAPRRTGGARRQLGLGQEARELHRHAQSRVPACDLPGIGAVACTAVRRLLSEALSGSAPLAPKTHITPRERCSE
ncbi:hypothetical protein MTO96_002279 [Rhipicephalus appendiculatus]